MSSESGQIYELIPKVMADLGAIGKNQTNTFDRYKFRGIDDLYNAMHGPMSRNGVFLVPHEIIDVQHRETLTQKDKTQIECIMVVRFRLYGPDGSYVEGVAEGVGLDRGDKASNKAHTAAIKVFLFETFMIPTDENMDSEKDSPQREPQQDAYKPPHGTVEPQPGDMPTQPPTTLQKAKTALMKWALDQHEAAGGTNGATWLQGVAKNVLDGKTATSMRDVQAVREAIESGNYNMITGDWIPGDARD